MQRVFEEIDFWVGLVFLIDFFFLAASRLLIF